MTTAIIIIFVFFNQAAFAAALHFYLKNWRELQEANLSKRLEIYRKRIARTNRENRIWSRDCRRSKICRV